MVRFYQTYKLYIFPTAVVLSSLFLIMFAIIPQTVKLINNQKTAGDLISRSKLLEDKAFALESYDEEDLSSKMRFALSAFPADKDYGSILGLLQQLVARSGFSLLSVTMGGAGNKLGKANSYPIKIQVTGARALFRTVLDNLENSPRLIRISSIDISSNQITQTIDASLEVGVLYSQLPQGFGTEESPLPQITKEDEQLLANLRGVSEELLRSEAPEATGSSMATSPRGKSDPFE